MSRTKPLLQELAAGAGVCFNGPNPWDPQVHDQRLYDRVLSQGSLGLGEAYMDGWWDCKALDEFACRVLRAQLDVKSTRKLGLILRVLPAVLFNQQRRGRAHQVGEQHYDAGNDLFETMLDRRLTYTCGYWREADCLDAAQEAKLDLVCRKLGLREGQRVLDIGCGWGSFAQFAAERYGARVLGITISKEQVALGRQRCAGLPVELRLQDYRELDEPEGFDHIVSLGMFEHVGYKNYRTFMEIAHRLLKDDGLLLLHTIGGNWSVHDTDPWMKTYIFPNSMLPSIKQIAGAIERLFVMEDWHNFGADYDRTLMAWHENISNGWERLKDRYDERFYRMWTYFLKSCAGSFRARRNQLWQVVLSKYGLAGGYRSVR